MPVFDYDNDYDYERPQKPAGPPPNGIPDPSYG